MAEMKKTILKEVSSKNKDGLDTPIPIGVEFENVIDTRNKYYKHYSLDQFFDHYMNYMKNANFLYYGEREPENKHSCIWIDTSNRVHYRMDKIEDDFYEVFLSPTFIGKGYEYGLMDQENNSISGFFRNPTKIKKITILEEICPINMSKWFSNCSSAEFEGLEKIDTSEVISLLQCFYNCRGLKDITQLSNWNVNNVETMAFCFGYSGIKDLDPLKYWNTDSLKDLQACFPSTQITNTDGLINWKINKVTRLDSLFANCVWLTNVNGLAKWDTSNVTNISVCFNGVNKVKTFEPLNNWDVSKVYSDRDVFKNTTGILPDWYKE